MQLLYRKVRFILVLIGILSGLLNGCRQPLAPADKWRAKMLEAHGGAAALEQVSTIVFRGTIATRADKGTVVLILSRPQKLRATMRYSNRHEDRILLGSRGWRNSGAGFEEAAGYSLDAMIFQYNHLCLPMGLLDENYKISYAEKKIDGKIFPALELTGANGPPMAVTVDPETGLIQMVEGRIRMGSREVVMGVGYGDYGGAAGVMLPHRIINYVNGVAIAESRFDSVVVNRDLDQNVFNVNQEAAGE